jgi:hypothetical protein
MADVRSGWSTWSVATKLTVGVGLAIAGILVAGLNFLT